MSKLRITLGAVSRPLESLNIRTGDWGTEYPVVIKENCKACGDCVVYCPDLCIELVETGEVDEKGKKKKVARINYDYCKGCGTCSVVCRHDAIKMEIKEIYRG